MKSPSLFKLVTGFFVNHLAAERNVSENTSKTYRDGFKLLLKFASQFENCPVTNLQISNLTPEVILKFLDYLEHKRGNSIRTRNARLAMIHSFFQYVIYEDPLSANLCEKVLRIPQKKATFPTLEYLTGEETKQILDSIDRSTPTGRRDYLLIALLYDTGARVQEVLDLTPCDFRFGTPAHVKITGKGRKQRLCPLLPQTVRLVENFLKENNRTLTDTEPVFKNKQGRKFSRHGVCYILKKYVRIAETNMHSLLRRKISPHILRHSKAVHLLQSGIPPVTIKDFLGHVDVRTTQIYVKTDLEAKRKALEQGGSPASCSGMSKIPADLIDWLEAL
jgi:site-specific recombinase XerD